jgi:hypothetical protein
VAPPAPPSGPPPPAAEPPSAPPAAAPPAAAPAPAAVYFSPYKQGAQNGRFEVSDGATKLLYVNEWEAKWCSDNRAERKPDNGYKAAVNGVPGRPITTIASWSNGRVGVLSYLAHANKQQLQQLDYVLLIDPGYYGQMECEREQNAGGALVGWLRTNSEAHLVVISTSEISQQENSRGIQETYFNAIRSSIRRDGADLNSHEATAGWHPIN